MYTLMSSSASCAVPFTSGSVSISLSRGTTNRRVELTVNACQMTEAGCRQASYGRFRMAAEFQTLNLDPLPVGVVVGETYKRIADSVWNPGGKGRCCLRSPDWLWLPVLAPAHRLTW